MHLLYLRIYQSTKGIRSFLKCDLLRILPKVTRDLDVVKKVYFLFLVLSIFMQKTNF